MNKRYILLAAICVIALVITGCEKKIDKAKQVAEAVVETAKEVAEEVAEEEAKEQSKQEAEEPTDTPAPAKQEAKPTDTPVAKPADKPAEEPEEEGVPEIKDYDDLKGYRQEIKSTVLIDGQLDHDFTMNLEYDAVTPAMRYVMKGTDQDGVEFETEYVMIGDTMYTRMDDEWIAMSTPDQSILDDVSPWAQPQHWVDDDCQRKGKDNIGGESCVHYVCDIDAASMASQAAFEGATGISDMRGEFWISTKYQVPVQSIITWKGVDDGKKIEYRHEVLSTDLDVAVKIEKPEGVQEPGVGGDLPVYPNATKVLAMAGMSTYEVEAPIAEVQTWYEKELAKAGYKLDAGNSMVPMMMVFDGTDDHLRLSLTEDGGKVTIMLMQEPQ